MGHFIRLYTHRPAILTVAEYEKVKRHIDARRMAAEIGVDDWTLADELVQLLLKDNEMRYLKAKQAEEATC